MAEKWVNKTKKKITQNLIQREVLLGTIREHT